MTASRVNPRASAGLIVVCVRQTQVLADEVRVGGGRVRLLSAPPVLGRLIQRDERGRRALHVAGLRYS